MRAEPTRRGNSRPGRGAAVAVLAASLMATGCGFVQARIAMKEGNAFYNTKHFDEAVEQYKKVIEIDPAYRDAYTNLGLAYLSLYQPGSTHEKDIGYSKGAIKAFKDYLAIDPDNEKVKNYLVEVCQKSNNTEEAIQFFQAEVARHPDDVRTITIIGSLYAKIGNIDEALKWMDKRVQVEPNNSEAYYTIGVNCWARSYNHMDLALEERYAILDKGLAALDKAIELKPDSFESYTYKNLILRQKASFDTSPAQRL
ncbi:MAG TPA: tetratricopeptide repeat protein, partial [Verrucomicrobiae bacterium]|nr:tetratricopeptide repeat protein [Verrucomicrobiae bacterium]